MKSGKFHFSKKKLIVILVIAALIAVGFYSCQKAAVAAAEKLVPKTQVTALKKTSLQNTVSVSGNIESNTSKNVYTVLNNPIKQVNVKVGDQVKAGDILALLDTSTISKDVEQAQYSVQTEEESNRLALEKAKSDYDNLLNQYNNNLNSDLLAANAAVKSAEQDLKNEKTTYDYDKYLNSIGELSKLALDQEAAKVQSLQLVYDKAVSTLNTTQNKVQQDLNTAKNAYEVAQAKCKDKSQEVTLAKQQQNLKDGIVTSPIDGTVTVSNAVVGATPNGVLFTVENTGDLIVKAEVKEFDVAHVTVGKRVIIKTDATGSTEIPGVVTRIAPAATAAQSVGMQGAATAATQGNSNPTYTAEIKVTGSNPNLRIGMKARLNIVLDEKSDIYKVPYDAVLHKPDGSAYVLVASKEGAVYKAKELPVQTGLENDISIEISGSGVKDGLQVISSPENLTAGSILKL